MSNETLDINTITLGPTAGHTVVNQESLFSKKTSEVQIEVPKQQTSRYTCEFIDSIINSYINNRLNGYSEINELKRKSLLRSFVFDYHNRPAQESRDKMISDFMFKFFGWEHKENLWVGKIFGYEFKFKPSGTGNCQVAVFAHFNSFLQVCDFLNKILVRFEINYSQYELVSLFLHYMRVVKSAINKSLLIDVYSNLGGRTKKEFEDNFSAFMNVILYEEYRSTNGSAMKIVILKVPNDTTWKK